MSKYNPNIHQRKTIRLKGYDYSQEGLYFITICTKNKECLFGNIANDVMILNDAGMAVEKCWYEIPNHFPNTKLHQMVVMPNHFHGIIEITATTTAPTTTSVRTPTSAPTTTTAATVAVAVTIANGWVNCAWF